MKHRTQCHFSRSRSLLRMLRPLVVALGSVFGGPASADDFESRALAHVSQQYGIPATDLKTVERATAQLPLTGVDLAEFKVMTHDGRSYGVSLNVATQQVVDPEAAAGRERQARRAAFGVIEPALFKRVQQNAAERVPVAVWVSMEDPGQIARARTPDGRRLSVDATSLALRVNTAQVGAADAARRLGAELKQADLVPVFFTELNSTQITALARRTDVVSIEGIPQNLTRLNDDSATSDRYRFVWAVASGTGAKVAVHEDDGVDNVNPFVNNPTHGVIYWNPSSPNIGSHATNVAGVVASTHNWRRGGAYNASQILSANFQSFSSAVNIVNSASWAISNGADTINMSWGGCSSGGQTFYTRWVDYLVKTFGHNVVVSAGNSNCGTPNYVLEPSLGWNTISVGAYWDRDTGLRSDDVLSSFTSFENPLDPNSGRRYEKPDVAAMGGQSDSSGCHGTETTGIGDGANDVTCGTSFSAPDVAALTTLVVGKNTLLRGAAEAVKAIIMAGATHNIVDGANYRSCPSSPVPGDCRDGAGAIDAYQTIQNIVVPGNWRFPGFITPASFGASGNIDFPVTIPSGRKVRIAMAWDSTATCSTLGTSTQACASDVLNADLDLHLLNPSGVVVASAASFQNSAEVIDYTTIVAGSYTLRVHNFRFDAGSNTYLGLAWNLNTVDSRNPLTLVASFPLNTTKFAQTTDKGSSFWDNYSGPAPGCAAFLSPETGLEKVYRITTTSTGTIGATLSGISGFTGVGSDIDVIILKKSGAVSSLNTQVVACGDATATASAQPAGTYYVVVDGFSGAVAQFNLTVNFAAGASLSAPEPQSLPQRH